MTEPRWLSESEQHAWRSYLHMQARLSASINRQLQTESNLSLADFDVLVQLTDVPDGRLRPFQLGRAVHWEKSRLSHHVARMERRGLVSRDECSDDGRGAFVVITESGRRAMEEAAPRHVEAVRRMVFDGLSEAQVEALGQISRHVLARIETEEAPCDGRPT